MAQQPRIAAPVDLKDVDSQRQAEYGGLTAVKSDGLPRPPTEKKEEPAEPARADCPHCLRNIHEPPEEPTALDKKEFVRATLGNRTYVKKYTLFGNLAVRMKSLTTRRAEELYQRLQKEYDESKLKNAEEWDVWRERYRLLLTLESAEGHDSRKVIPKLEELPGSDEWRSLVEERFLGLSKPLYQALMDVGRRFDAHLTTLTRRAASSDFWLTVGQD